MGYSKKTGSLWILWCKNNSTEKSEENLKCYKIKKTTKNIGTIKLLVTSP